MSENSPLKTVKTTDGKEHKIATEISIRNKKYVVTIDKNVFVKADDGSFTQCEKDDEYAKIIFETLKPAKSLDINTKER